MKKVFKIIAVLAVLVSVEASAQIIMPTNYYGSGQQQQQIDPTAIINSQIQNQVYAAMATPGTELNQALVNVYAKKMIQEMTNPTVDPVTAHMNAVQERWLIENMDRNQVVQNSIQNIVEGQYETMAHNAQIANDISEAQAHYAYKKSVTCNPGMNMLLNPECMNIDLANTMAAQQQMRAIRDAQTAAYFQNLMQWN